MNGPRVRNKGIRTVRVADLEEAEWNFRTHPEAQAKALDATVEQIGWYGYPDVFEDAGGRLKICDGHLRKAHLLAKYGPDAEIEVNVCDFDEAEAKIATATHDPLAEMAAASRESLEGLLGEVDLDSPELLAHLNAKLDDLAPPPADLEDDEPPPVPSDADVVSQRGDVWLLGEHRLLCGDSTKESDVERLLDGRKPFIMVTDPPYGVKYDPTWRDHANNLPRFDTQNKALESVLNDDRADWSDAYVLFPGVVAYTWSPGGGGLLTTGQSLIFAGFELRTQLIWRKQHFVVSRGHYHGQHEPCWYGVRPGQSAKWCGDRTQSTTWDIKNQCPVGGGDKTEKTGHGTQKPIECMGRPLRNHGGPEDDVYDPFLGSGTTLIAAEQLKRRCLALELHPPYVDVAVRRWQNLTAQQARLEATGQTFDEVEAARKNALQGQPGP